MTQPAEVAEEASGPQSVAELLLEITDMSGVSIEDAQTLPTVGRFIPPPGPSGKPAIWELAGGVPGREKELLIIGLFVSGDDMLAYCLPTANVDSRGVPVAPSRFTVSRKASSVFSETMPLETLMSEMAEEIADLYNIVGVRSREDCEVETCGASNEADARFCKECGAPMPTDLDDEPAPPHPPGPSLVQPS
jgi:hypothetical protein